MKTQKCAEPPLFVIPPPPDILWENSEKNMGLSVSPLLHACIRQHSLVTHQSMAAIVRAILSDYYLGKDKI